MTYGRIGGQRGGAGGGKLGFPSPPDPGPVFARSVQGLCLKPLVFMLKILNLSRILAPSTSQTGAVHILGNKRVMGFRLAQPSCKLIGSVLTKHAMFFSNRFDPDFHNVKQMYGNVSFKQCKLTCVCVTRRRLAKVQVI